MRMIEVQMMVPEDVLVDAGEDVGRLLEQQAEVDVSPPLRSLLLALDDAITDAFGVRTDLSQAVLQR